MCVRAGLINISGYLARQQESCEEMCASAKTRAQLELKQVSGGSIEG